VKDVRNYGVAGRSPARRAVLQLTAAGEDGGVGLRAIPELTSESHVGLSALGAKREGG
jgi:hypothetical protein